jgi:hypothetical protein
MKTQDFLNNARALSYIVQDEWTKAFISSLIDQVNKGHRLTEKQKLFFDQKLQLVLHPPKEEDDIPKVFTLKEWFTLPEDNDRKIMFIEDLRNIVGISDKEIAWFTQFIQRIVKKIHKGNTLTDDEKHILRTKYNLYSVAFN